MLKGLAILMMLFLHLFNHDDAYFVIFNVSGEPFVKWLSRAANPVSFYAFLGGVGMYYVYNKYRSREQYLKSQFKRLLKLYIHYWAILLIFVSIGYVMGVPKYPGSIENIIANAIGFNTTYNAECWFLLPYAILTLIAPFVVFNVLDRYSISKTLVFALSLYIAVKYIISRYGALYLYGRMFVYTPILVLSLYPAFFIGAAFIKHWNWISLQINRNKNVGGWLWLLLIIVVITECVIHSAAVGLFYLVAVVVIFYAAPRWKIVDTILVRLGRHSMTMWLIHTWFCYYLFHNFIYGFKYPLLIYLALILTSITASYIIKFMLRPIVTRL